jgi:Domain of unknown function (DUF4352)
VTAPRVLGRLAGAGLALGVVLAGCAAAPPSPPPAPVNYPLAPRPVRKGEVPLDPAPVTAGDTIFELIGLSTGMPSVVGSHAEWPAKGQFTRIRLVISNGGRNSVPFDANRQLLRTADGVEHQPDPQAMLIKRQPGRFDLGANDRLEFDLYYDVPEDASPSALHAFGGPSLADFNDATGVVIPIKPA